MFEFATPRYFWLLLILIPHIIFEIFSRKKRKVRLPHPQLSLIKEVASFQFPFHILPVILRFLAVILLIASLMRPRLANERKEAEGEGIDIVLAMDVSGSMQALDFKPVNRLEAAKKVADDFIEKRETDRIGIVTFAGEAFTQCPLTLDYNILKKTVSSINIDEDANGTAIGMGLGTAVNRLRKSEAKSKVIVLITDGRNNSGKIEPLQAAELAAAYGIKIYTVGVGKEGYVDFPVNHPVYGRTTQKMKVDIDMKTLNKIAEITGTGFSGRAHNTEELKAIIDRIDKLEKTKIKIKNFVEYKEIFPILLILAMICLLAEFTLKVIFIPDLP